MNALKRVSIEGSRDEVKQIKLKLSKFGYFMKNQRLQAILVNLR